MGRMGCGPPLENSIFLNLHGKITLPKICLKSPGKLEYPSNPQPPIFPEKKIMGRAWYPMQMSHVTNCFRQT